MEAARVDGPMTVAQSYLLAGALQAQGIRTSPVSMQVQWQPGEETLSVSFQRRASNHHLALL